MGHNQGPMLVLSGADLMDGTPVFDIKTLRAPSRRLMPGGYRFFTEQAGDFP